MFHCGSLNLTVKEAARDMLACPVSVQDDHLLDIASDHDVRIVTYDNELPALPLVPEGGDQIREHGTWRNCIFGLVRDHGLSLIHI